ncbi:MAG: protein translocase subunit SecD, partial [Deltaproteobacteria bacterium]|nr:protein translocase subunit SecD [Deltaproteobacteria bacterium]
MKSILSRVLLLGGFTLVALVLFLPSTPISKKLPSFWVDNIPKIVLGLDLQGGMHLVLDVDRDKAVENFVGRLSDSVEGSLKDGGAPFISVRTRGTDITVKYLSPGAVDSIKQIVSENFSNVLTSGVVDDKAVVFTLTEAEAVRIRDWATTQVLETIRNRIDKFGVSEPLIQRQGEREIVIQLPGLKDTKRAIDLIGKKAVLEFRLL